MPKAVKSSLRANLKKGRRGKRADGRFGISEQPFWRERYKTGVWMAGFAEATILTFLKLEKGEEQWDEDRARSGGVTGAIC